MARSSVRTLLWALTVMGAFVGGIAFERFGREAQAMPSGVATIVVPPGGLVFRSVEGKALARISEDARGGAIELFDDRQEVNARVQGPRTTLAHENPYSADEPDPWKPAEPHAAFQTGF